MSVIESWYPAAADGHCTLLEPTRGKEFEEIYCVYPWLQKFYMSWELNFRPVGLYDWMHENNWFPIAVCIFYMAAIYFGQKFMETREPYVMRKTLAAWNLLLSVFSVLGVARILPSLAHNVYHYGFDNYICMDPENSIGASITGVWLMFFVLSKPAELIDTFFIVAHKKKLLLLHWYHHVTVLICCWFTFVTHCPPGMIYTCINFGVHGIMYFYYFLMAIRCKPKWFNPKWITIAQITQMVIGTMVTMRAFFVVGREGCWATWDNNMGTMVMYVSYFFLFLKFFFERYGLGFKVDAKAVPKKKAA